MNLEDLKEKLSVNNIPLRWYSLNDGLKPDACILMENYGVWEFFYLDEKGNRLDMRFFYSAEEAYEFLWKKMENQLRIFKGK